jgi:hypothetical protein
MIRFPDWHDRLCVYLDRVTDEPFKWGEHDCALFGADAVERMTGTDIAADYRGQYNDYPSACRALRECGQGTLLKSMKHWFGEPISVHLAKRGDLVMKDRRTVGVCVGQFSWFVAEIGSGAGLIALPTASCRYAFTVPFEARV